MSWVRRLAMWSLRVYLLASLLLLASVSIVGSSEPGEHSTTVRVGTFPWLTYNRAGSERPGADGSVISTSGFNLSIDLVRLLVYVLLLGVGVIVFVRWSRRTRQPDRGAELPGRPGQPAGVPD